MHINICVVEVGTQCFTSNIEIWLNGLMREELLNLYQLLEVQMLIYKRGLVSVTAKEVR